MRKSMRKRSMPIVAFITLCFLCGCGLVTGKGDAQKVAESFLKDRIANGELGDDGYYSDVFCKNTEKNKWENVKRLVNKALGNLKGYSLAEWKAQSKVHTSELSGTFVVLLYNTEYEKGKGQETLTMHKGVTGGEFRIIGHRIDSPKIQELIDKGIEQVSGD